MNNNYSTLLRFILLIFFFGKGSVSQAAEGLVQCRVTNALPHPPRLQIGASGIVFERAIIGPTGKRSVSDIHILKNGRVLEAETKAGVEFFEGLTNSNSNFVTQCENSLGEVERLEDFKVFLGKAKQTNAKQKVIDAWRSGGLLDPTSEVYRKIRDYGQRKNYDFQENTVEDFLTGRDDWYNEIFKNNF